MRNPARQLRRMMRRMRPRVSAGRIGRRFPRGGLGRRGRRFGRGLRPGFGGGQGYEPGSDGPDDGGAAVREPRRPVPQTPVGGAPLPTEEESLPS